MVNTRCREYLAILPACLPACLLACLRFQSNGENTLPWFLIVCASILSVCLPACLPVPPQRLVDWVTSPHTQAVFPSRALDTCDTRDLPDYGLFREIKAAAAAEEAAIAEAQNSGGHHSFQGGLQQSPGQRTEPSPVANSWFRDSSQLNNPYGSRSHSQNSTFSNSVYTSGGESMLYGGGGYGSTSGSVGMHAGSAGSSIGSGLDSAAFAPSPSAPTHPPNQRSRVGGWFPWQSKSSGAATTTSVSIWEGLGAREGQRRSSWGGSGSNRAIKPGTNTGTSSKGDSRSNGRESSSSSGGAFIFRWWRGVFGGGGGGSAVPGSRGEASKLMSPSLGSLSRLAEPSQGEATYSLRGDGRGPQGGVLLGEEFVRGAHETGGTFVPAAGPHLREEACGQADPAADRGGATTRKGPQQQQQQQQRRHRRGGSGDGVRSGTIGNPTVVEQLPVWTSADCENGGRRRGGNGSSAYDQRGRDSAPIPPSVQGAPSTVIRQDPSFMARQDSKLMARQDPSLMTRQDRLHVVGQDPSLMTRQDPSLVARQDRLLISGHHPLLMGHQNPSLRARQDPSGMARQGPTYKARQDTSLMAQGYRDVDRSDYGRGMNLDVKPRGAANPVIAGVPPTTDQACVGRGSADAEVDRR